MHDSLHARVYAAGKKPWIHDHTSVLVNESARTQNQWISKDATIHPYSVSTKYFSSDQYQ